MQQKPQMTAIGNRPANVAKLHSIDGVYVQCRLPSGEDTFVLLKDILTISEKDMAERIVKRGQIRQ